jgi:hypothetical protein
MLNAAAAVAPAPAVPVPSPNLNVTNIDLTIAGTKTILIPGNLLICNDMRVVATGAVAMDAFIKVQFDPYDNLSPSMVFARGQSLAQYGFQGVILTWDAQPGITAQVVIVCE